MNFSTNLIKLMKVFFILDETERWRQRKIGLTYFQIEFQRQKLLKTVGKNFVF